MTTKDLYTLAQESGMTEEEFIDELIQCFAAQASILLGEVGFGTTYEYATPFSEHTLMIAVRKEKNSKVTIN